MSARLMSLFAAGAIAGGMLTPAQADPIEEFYQGRTMTVTVPSGAAGTYGLLAQVLSRHLPKHIPGNPTMVQVYIEDGLRATNHLYNVAAKDGSVIGLLSQSAPVRQVERPEGVQYDARDFPTIGLITGANGAFSVANSAPTQDIEEMKEVEITAGSNHTSGYGYTVPQVMNHYLGTKIRVITGYTSGADSDLAMVRGEIDSKWSSWQAVKVRYPEWVDGSFARVVLQVGAERAPDLQDVPTLIDLAENDEQREVFTFMSANNAIARGLVTPPGVPEERVVALREAFDALLEDQEFLDEMEQTGLDLDPRDWRWYENIIADMVNTPDHVIENTRRAIGQN
jgi:tripartite-type tricarboxylate transporter receptor subunit TctC